MARSIRSDLYAFIYSPSLLDSSKVSKIIGLAGVERFLDKYARGDIVVYYVKRDAVRAKCVYEACSDVPREDFEACVADCFVESIREVAERVAESILEAGKVIAGEEG